MCYSEVEYGTSSAIQELIEYDRLRNIQKLVAIQATP